MQIDGTILRDIGLLITIAGAFGKIVWDYANVKARLTALEKEDDKAETFRKDMYDFARETRDRLTRVESELKHRNGK